MSFRSKSWRRLQSATWILQYLGPNRQLLCTKINHKYKLIVGITCLFVCHVDDRNFVNRQLFKDVYYGFGKLLYAVSAWWSFASAADRQRLQALLQRGIRSGMFPRNT